MSLMTTGEAETIDAAIEPPFTVCPKCAKETYGVLHVGLRAYLRACTDCQIKNGKLTSKPGFFALPKISKKVIYLDQNILSGIVKAFRPELRKGKMEAEVEQNWKLLFQKLDRLRKLQLIVCPFSIFHRRESFVASDPLRLRLKALYKRLSNFVEFGEQMDITAVQAYQYAKHSCDPLEPVFVGDPEQVTIGTVNSWERWSMKSVMTDYDWKPEYKGMLIEQNNNSEVEFQRIYSGWVDEKLPIEDRYTKEASGYGNEIRRVYTLKLMKQFPLTLPPAIAEKVNELWDEHPYIELIDNVYDLFSGGSEITNPLILRQVIDFLASEELQQNVPAIHIEPRLWAAVSKHAIAEKSARKTMKKGDPTDIAAIATYLPYCDAMIIDNAWKSELTSNPAKSEFQKYNTEIFSFNQMPKLMSYLEQIENSASSDHLRRIKEIYGEVEESDPFDAVSMKLYSQPIEETVSG
ncbi:MAG: hypothetical protein PHU04_02795 [Candidatus Peribacteraceae bacterium]|nr:hypothetical protein [Candidatus Peribacteraceae bacterium]